MDKEASNAIYLNLIKEVIEVQRADVEAKKVDVEAKRLEVEVKMADAEAKKLEAEARIADVVPRESMKPYNQSSQAYAYIYP